MAANILQFLTAAAVIVLAGAALTQFGEILSQRTKLGGMVVGGILIAGATSLPELAINFNVVRNGAPDLTAGDLIGSNLFNLLILACCDLTRYSRGSLLTRTSAANTLAAVTSIALVGLVAIFIHLGTRLGDATFLRLGPSAFVIALVYLAGLRVIYLRREEPSTGPEKEENEHVIGVLKKIGTKGAAAGFAGAALLILAAAPFLATAAEKLAEESGLGGTFFGSTFVACCTSLPEVVTVVSAVRMKSFDIAVGNVFGSNCMNMAFFAPLDLVDRGALLSSVSLHHVYTALCVIVASSVVILGQLLHVERRKPFRELDALATIATVLAALTGLYFLSRE